MFEKFLKNAVKRLTTENPQNMTETMLNYAYAKNERVYLRYANGTEDIDLCEYISQLTNENGCNLSADDVMQGYCLETGCDCEIGILYVLAVQAAELRERLKHYENLEEQGLLQMLPCKVGDTVYICTCFGFWYASHEINKCEMQIKNIRITDNKIIFEAEKGIYNTDFFELKDIGKTVFLTKAAAEKTLKEHEQK